VIGGGGSKALKIRGKRFRGIHLTIRFCGMIGEFTKNVSGVFVLAHEIVSWSAGSVAFNPRTTELRGADPDNLGEMTSSFLEYCQQAFLDQG